MSQTTAGEDHALSEPIPAVLRPRGIPPGISARRVLRLLGVLAALAALAALVAVLYAASTHAVPGDSDGATIVLEGRSIALGDLTLHGWAGGFDVFWTLDALVYGVAVATFGVTPVLLNLVPALLAAGVVALGVVLARDGQRGLPAWSGGVTVVAILGLPSFALSSFFLRGPLHVATTLWVLGAFAALKRGGYGWRWCLAVVLLAMGILGDLQTLAFGVCVVAACGIVAMRRTRDWRQGTPELAAAVASAVLAIAVRALAKAVGTFVLVGPNTRADKAQMVHNVPLAFTLFSKLLGVGTGDVGTGGAPAGFFAAHLVVLAVVAFALASALGALVLAVVRGDRTDVLGSARHPAGGETASAWRLDDLLVVAVVADGAVFCFLAYYETITFARYLTAAVIFAAVLAGRVVARHVGSRSAKARSGAAVKAPWRLAGWAGVATVAALATAFGFEASGGAAVQPATALGHFLAEHHLNQGVGDYWSASIVTVESHDTVKVRPLTSTSPGRVVAYQHGDLRWWGPSQQFDFVVMNAGDPFGGVSPASVTRTFGVPSHTYAVPGGYEVFVYAHPFSIPAPERA